MSEAEENVSEEAMEIGWPRNVRHVAHVTFDRFNGFLGLPSEFEPDVPKKAPSASATVFGVSTESMQLAYDSSGNCIPVILLLMQSRLYAQGGLQVEGIFRLTADNAEEESVRKQLNGGILPDGINVHCLAGLIKAWFRELPAGILDSLPPQQVMQCENEEDYVDLIRLLPPTQASLLNWAINLMADVVQHEHLNKMNARNIALVFAPNLSQVRDPLTALMYAVQVMNLLKTLIDRIVRQRQNSIVEGNVSEESDHQSPEQSCDEHTDAEDDYDPESDIAEAFEEEDEVEDEIAVEEGGIETAETSIPSPPAVEKITDRVTLNPIRGEETVLNTSDIEAFDQRDSTGTASAKRNIGESLCSSSAINNDFPREILLQPPELPLVATRLKVGVKKSISNFNRVYSTADRSEAWR